MSIVKRKPVIGVCDQVRLKLACLADETSYGLEISAIASKSIILPRQWITKALIRLSGCAGWSAALLFAYGKSRFSPDVAQTNCGSSVISVLVCCQSFRFDPKKPWVHLVPKHVFLNVICRDFTKQGAYPWNWDLKWTSPPVHEQSPSVHEQSQPVSKITTEMIAYRLLSCKTGV